MHAGGGLIVQSVSVVVAERHIADGYTEATETSD